MNGLKYPTEWENVTRDGSVQRLRTPGSWIVRSTSNYISMDKSVACSEAMIEIMDKANKGPWNLEVK